MAPPGLPELPDIRGLDPRRLSVTELIDLHGTLGRWVAAVESLPHSEAPDDDLVEAVNRLLRALTSERAERQADERRDS